jgi:hypothetical protein
MDSRTLSQPTVVVAIADSELLDQMLAITAWSALSHLS